MFAISMALVAIANAFPDTADSYQVNVHRKGGYGNNNQQNQYGGGNGQNNHGGGNQGYGHVSSEFSKENFRALHVIQLGYFRAVAAATTTTTTMGMGAAVTTAATRAMDM